ncbi:hypothetical protein LWC34_09225 [Kibdelosporangium philippinense]|uniref:Uncharacterized protein n=1 Tax=Kibdelosporangium philippinense TaxID=211113 RepID=A0ABS8Z525_9PSEU|nr:hypothetical protein [Kibdelosporangium philippinense]MCE7003008.1 hypothetical protein [Kibdelosporangium philippinense]
MKRFSQLKPTSWGDTPIIQRPPRRRGRVAAVLLRAVTPGTRLLLLLVRLCLALVRLRGLFLLNDPHARRWLVSGARPRDAADGSRHHGRPSNEQSYGPLPHLLIPSVISR